MSNETYDLVVIGSGPAGYKSAITAAHLGAKVALLEKGSAGGTCLNEGCIPKKTLLHLASLLEDVAALTGRGLVGHVRGDLAAAMAHKDEVVAAMRQNFPLWLKRLGVQLIAGDGRLLPGRRVVLRDADGGSRTLAAGKVILATGSRPRELDVCPADGERILNSRQFMADLRQVPDSVLFVGGGAIGAEFGYLLHQFGSRVTIVERADRLLAGKRVPERASGFLERKFQRLGIEVRKNDTVVAAARDAAGVHVTFADGDTRHFERVVVAAGRCPNSEALGLAEAGVEVDEDGHVRTGPYLETTAEGVYAVGDLRRGPMTANAALYDAKLAGANAVQGNRERPNYHMVPMVIHSAYEIAAVGYTEEQAEDAGFDAEVARVSLGGSGKARAHHDYEGYVEVVHDGETGQLLGGCIVGPEAGEQIQVVAAACQHPRGLWLFRDMSYSHPSWCEELENAIDPHAHAFEKSEREIFRPGIHAGHR